MNPVINFAVSEVGKRSAAFNFFLIGIGGPGGTGKSTFAKNLSEYLQESVVISLDDYRFSREERSKTGLKGSNPAANRIVLIKEHFDLLRSGNSIKKPVYDHSTGKTDNSEILKPERYIIAEGELAFSDELIGSFDLNFFLDSDHTTQLNSRMKRDKSSKNLTEAEIKTLFYESNISDFGKFYAHNKKNADIILFSDNKYNLSIISVR